MTNRPKLTLYVVKETFCISKVEVACAGSTRLPCCHGACPAYGVLLGSYAAYAISSAILTMRNTINKSWRHNACNPSTHAFSMLNVAIIISDTLRMRSTR